MSYNLKVIIFLLKMTSVPFLLLFTVLKSPVFQRKENIIFIAIPQYQEEGCFIFFYMNYVVLKNKLA